MMQTIYRIKTKPRLLDQEKVWYMPQVKRWWFPFWTDMEIVGEVDEEGAREFIRDQDCPVSKEAYKSIGKVVWVGSLAELCSEEGK